MTGKRFTYNVNKNCIECDGKFVAYLDSVDGFRIANKLAALAEENEQLKSSDTITDLETEIMKLKEENKFLRNKVATYKKGNALLKKSMDKEWK